MRITIMITTLWLLIVVSLQLTYVGTKVETLIKQQDQIIQTLQVQLSTPILRPEDVETYQTFTATPEPKQTTILVKK